MKMEEKGIDLDVTDSTELEDLGNNFDDDYYYRDDDYYYEEELGEEDLGDDDERPEYDIGSDDDDDFDFDYYNRDDDDYYNRDDDDDDEEEEEDNRGFKVSDKAEGLLKKQMEEFESDEEERRGKDDDAGAGDGILGHSRLTDESGKAFNTLGDGDLKKKKKKGGDDDDDYDRKMNVAGPVYGNKEDDEIEKPDFDKEDELPEEGKRKRKKMDCDQNCQKKLINRRGGKWIDVNYG